MLLRFFSTDPATTEIYTLSLHDALPIYGAPVVIVQPGSIYGRGDHTQIGGFLERGVRGKPVFLPFGSVGLNWVFVDDRSEEHTSELQSQSNLVCRLLLEKKK